MRGPFIKVKDVQVLKATPAALLCRIQGDQFWVPQSQVHDDSEVYQEGDKGALVCSEWIAESKGFKQHGDDYEPAT